MEFPKIQVYIITYNRPNTLVKAIDSVLRQTYPNVELVVSDNSTNDETYNALSSSVAWGHYKYIRRNPSVSGVEHLRVALSEAKTDYFMVFHDDDEMLPNMVEELYKAISQNDSYSAAGANARIIKYGREAHLAFENENSVLINGEALIQRYNIGSIAPFPSYMYHRAVIAEIRPDYKSKGGKYCDVSFLYDICNRGPIVYVGEPLMKYYMHEGQDSGSFDFKKHIQLTNYLKRSAVCRNMLTGLRLYHIYNNAIDGYRDGTIIYKLSIMKILWKYKMKHYYLKYLIRYIQSKFYV